MKPFGAAKQIAFVFTLVVIIYFVSFYAIEHRRDRNGPWQVTFTNEAGSPALLVNEPKLNLSNIRIIFPGEHAVFTNDTIAFDQFQPVPFDVPFGECLFEDLVFKPGTVVFKMFGHEIQLLPRVLTIDKTEYAWQSGCAYSISSGQQQNTNNAAHYAH